MIDRIIQYPRVNPTASELVFQDKFGMTALAYAAKIAAPVEVLESMIALYEQDDGTVQMGTESGRVPYTLVVCEKKDILRTTCVRSRLPLHHAAKVHPDPDAIKLLIRHHPPALFEKDCEGEIPLTIAVMDNESPAVVTLLRDANFAYKQGNRPLLEALVGPLVGAHSGYDITEDERPLVASTAEDESIGLYAICEWWNKLLARIDQFPIAVTILELHRLDEWGETQFSFTVKSVAPVAVVESMIKLGTQDPEKRNILDIADSAFRLPLHYAANRPEVIKLLVRHHPNALFRKDCKGALPLNFFRYATPETITLLTAATDAFTWFDIERLISLVGSSTTLDSLAAPSRMLAALACIKQSHAGFYSRIGDNAVSQVIYSFLC